MTISSASAAYQASPVQFPPASKTNQTNSLSSPRKDSVHLSAEALAASSQLTNTENSVTNNLDQNSNTH